MKKSQRDFGFILSLGLIIAVGSYWFVKEMPMDNLEHYVDYLGDKLVSLVPKAQEKEELAQLYEKFKTRVSEKNIDPAEVEQIAAAIINLSNANDSLSLEEAESLLESVTSDVPMDSVYFVTRPKLGKSEMDWEKLQEKLSNVYQLELGLGQTDLPEIKKPEFRVDANLNVIIDSRVKEELEKANLLRELEMKKQIVWLDNFEEKIDHNMSELKIEMEAAIAEQERMNEQILKLRVLSQPLVEEGILMVDSLDIVKVIPWDSIKHSIDIEVEQMKKEQNQLYREKKKYKE